MTKLNVFSEEKEKPGFAWGNNELDKNAMGGTEMMKYGLYDRLPDNLRDKYQIITSRVREMDGRPAILWLHDLWNDPEAQHLKDPSSRERFEKLVFVSNFQAYGYHLGLGVPYSESMVLRNAIDPIQLEGNEKSDDVINLIYHTTPHRGLNVLLAAYDKLSEHYKDKLHLDVYSSFEAYGWPQRDEEFKELFDTCREHPHITYHGYKPNDVVREALKKAHIFAYPSIWLETSCIAAIEAMSAGACVVCPNYGALPETTGSFAHMYQFSEDLNEHANRFVKVLNDTIRSMNHDTMAVKLEMQKAWTDSFYCWDYRAAEWQIFLESLEK